MSTPELSRAALARTQMELLQKVIRLEYVVRRARSSELDQSYRQLVHELITANLDALVAVDKTLAALESTHVHYRSLAQDSLIIDLSPD